MLRFTTTTPFRRKIRRKTWVTDRISGASDDVVPTLLAATIRVEP
jgi:hypothetical protein